MKQNFPLKYFYGESVNAIESQIWGCLIANLLLTVVNRKVKRRWAFSNLVTAVRQMLMYYVDIFCFLENPERTWEKSTLNDARPAQDSWPYSFEVGLAFPDRCFASTIIPLYQRFDILE